MSNAEIPRRKNTMRFFVSGAMLIVLLFILGFFAVNNLYGGALTPSTRPRTATILAINDVYRLTGPDRGAGGGGLARVRALREKLEVANPDLLLLHAGDFLSPSLLGKTYKGEQMVDLLNLLDGNPKAGSFDPRMFVVFGNHEFDDTNCKRTGPLAARIRESEFTYIASNFDFKKAIAKGDACAGLHEVANLVAPYKDKIVPYKVVKSGDLQIGIYGLSIGNADYEAVMIPDVVHTSCEMVKKLKNLGVDVVVALTHLNWTTDLSLLDLASDGTPLKKPACSVHPDVIVGGHDHTRMALPRNGHPKIFKADADATSANEIIVSVDRFGKVSVRGININLKETEASDPLVLSRAEDWFRMHDELYCQAACKDLKDEKLKTCLANVPHGKCLKKEIATLTTTLEAEEIKNRSQETGFGDWFMDHVRRVSKADVAIFNAGGMRLNYDIAAGRKVVRRHMAEMFPYSNHMVVAAVPIPQLWHAMAYALSRPGEGAWLHFSGLAAKLGSDGKLERLVLLKEDGKRIELSKTSDRTVKVASNAFVLGNGDNHGFGLCASAKKCPDEIIEKFGRNWPEGVSDDPAQLVEEFMKRDGGMNGVAFKTDQRLCPPNRDPKECLIGRNQDSP